MFCKKCGAEIADESKFCTNCGIEISVENKKSITSENSVKNNCSNDNKIHKENEIAEIVTSPEPLKNEMLPIRQVYYIFGICIIIGIFVRFFAGIGFLGAMVWYIIDHSITNHKLLGLRKKKFKILSDATLSEIFNKIQAPIISKYGNNFMLEIEDERIIVSYGSYLYDITLNDDDTFSIWWRKTITRAFFSLSDYKDYRNVLVAMGIIAYEIQHAYDIC